MFSNREELEAEMKNLWREIVKLRHEIQNPTRTPALSSNEQSALVQKLMFLCARYGVMASENAKCRTSGV